MTQRTRNYRKPPAGYTPAVVAAIEGGDLKRVDLAEQLGVSLRYFNKMVAGTEYPTRERVGDLADALNVDRETLQFQAGYLPDDLADDLFTVALPKLRAFVKRNQANG